MKILGIVAFIQILILTIASTINRINVNIFLTPAVPEIVAEVLGGLILIYPVVNLLMHSKIKLGKWHFFGIFMTAVYTAFSMLIIAVILKEPKFTKAENIGYYLQVAFTIFSILVLRKKYGTTANEVKP